MISGKAWPQFDKRQVQGLDGTWDFLFLGDVEQSKIQIASLKYDEVMIVPWAWDASPIYAGKRGVAAYQKKISVKAESRYQLEFEAVSFLTDVFIDGKKIAQHRCAYTPFEVDFSSQGRSEITLTVLVDNRFNLEKAPLHDYFYDFHQWGGIVRSVWLHELKETYIERVQVAAKDLKGNISAEIFLGGKLTDGDLALTFNVGKEASRKPSVKIKNGSGRFDFQIDAPVVWTLKHPHLYPLCFEIGSGDERDDYQTRLGIRTVTTAGNKILLNGEQVKLLGYNRHESHPHFGPSLPPALMMTDLQHLKILGCNFVRGCHYPQNQNFLDLCDELGLLVWEETLGWQNHEKQFSSELFRADHADMTEAMIKRSFNHPSVIIWGFLNEGPSDQAFAGELYTETATQIRRLDNTRPITYASHKPMSDLYFHLADIISENLYPGWYGDREVTDRLPLIAPRLRACIAHLKATGFGDKPYILSEIGAEAIYGWRDPFNHFYTEEFQAAYLDTVLTESVKNEDYAGIALWHFSDARTYVGEPAMTRPRCYNNKGTLDEYRRPKLSYQTVKRHFTES